MGAKQSFPRERIPEGRTFVVTGANRGTKHCNVAI